MHRFLPVLVICCSFFHGIAQLESRRLSRSVSASIDNEVAPYISANGKALVFMMKDNFSGKWSVEYSRLVGGDWERSRSVDVVNKSDKLNQIGGCCLSPDGNTLYYTTKKYGGLGNSDIWQTKRNLQGVWSEPKNLGRPINSAQFDANPCISADGKYMYFMRCNSLSNSSTECCKIYVAERKGKDGWHEPVALPSPVNRGCESTPRIAADGKTLFFASKRAGGKGGLDIYVSRKENDSWTEPIPLEELNTEKDDQYVSMAGRENLIYYSAQGDETHDLFMGKLPEKYQPNAVTILDGKVVDSKSDMTTRGIVTITDLGNKKVIFRDLTEKHDGSFFAFLPAGSRYDVEVTSFNKKHLFFSELVDTKSQTKYKYTLLKAPLDPLKPGAALLLKGMEVHYGSLIEESKSELDRVLGIAKIAPQHKVHLLVIKQASAVVAVDSSANVDSLDTAPTIEEPSAPSELVPLIETYFKSKNVPEGKVSIEVVSESDPRLAGIDPASSPFEKVVLYIE